MHKPRLMNANPRLRRIVTGVAAIILVLSAGLACALEPSAGKATAIEPLSSGSLLQVVLGMGVVLGILLGGAWFMRRMGVGYSAAAGNMRVVGGLSLGARERMVLVQVGDTQLLIGIAPGSIQTLHVLDKPLDGDKPAPRGGFAERLAEVLKRSKG